MKKKWYRTSLAKGVLLTVSYVTLLLMAVCVLITAAMLGQGINPLKGKKEYTESQAFRQKLHEESGNILTQLTERSQFDGIADAPDSAVIDLNEFLNGEEISFKNTSGLAYSVKDLKKWVDKSWQVGSVYGDGKNIIECVKPDGSYEYFHFSEFYEKIKSGEFVCELNRETMEEQRTDRNLEMDNFLEVLEYGNLPDNIGYSSGIYGAVESISDKNGKELYKNVWNYMGVSVAEDFAPDGADSILDVLNTDSRWNGRVEEAFTALTDILHEMSSFVEAENILSGYREGYSNITYLYMDQDNGEIYSNNSSYSSLSQGEKYLKDIKEKGCYVITAEKPEECITDIVGLKTESSSGNYIYALSVDTGFSVQDSLAENRDIYMKYAGLGRGVIAAGVIAVILFLTAFVWLTIVAGRRPEDEKVHLCAFDRWFTEIGAGVVIAVWFAGIAVAERFIYITNQEGLWGSKQNIILIAVALSYTCMMFFIGYLSLVRRIKAGNMWKNSLTRRIFVFLGRLPGECRKLLEFCSRNTGSKIKAGALLTGFAFVQTVFTAAMIGAGAGIGLLLLMVIDFAALVWVLRRADGREKILEGLKRISGGELQYKIPEEKLSGEQKTEAELINNIGGGLDAAVESSLKNERMKTELITNVSHDIKTPLTSIINYVDLLKRENFTDPKICGYLDVLTEKAQRLKILTEDVVEASKASTGNISLEMTDIDFVEMIQQVIGEFEEKFQDKNLTMMVHFTDEPSVICADGRRMWRVLENIFNNVAKYAMEGTRVYAEIKNDKKKVVFSLKNISAQPLNISADELTERFIRGDVARNTEGSGLGLSIAKSLTELQGGEFRLYLDGDLFKVVIEFKAK